MMLLEMAAAGYGDRVAFVDAHAHQSITYQGLFDAAANAANDLRQSQASRFAILDVSNLAVPIGLFASSWAGMPYVPISYRLTDDEIDGLVERVKPAYLVTDADHIEHFHTDSIVRWHSRSEFLALARNGSATGAEPWSMDGDETAALLFTSGTTGAPKAAVLRQKTSRLIHPRLRRFHVRGRVGNRTGLRPSLPCRRNRRSAELRLFRPSAPFSLPTSRPKRGSNWPATRRSPPPSSFPPCCAASLKPSRANIMRECHTCSRSPTAAGKCRCPSLSERWRCSRTPTSPTPTVLQKTSFNHHGARTGRASGKPQPAKIGPVAAG